VSQVDTRELLGDPRWWAVSLVSALGAYVAVSQHLFFTGGLWQIPLFIGSVVGLIASTRLQAAIVAGGATLGLYALLPPALPFGGRVDTFGYVLALVLAASSSFALAHVRTAMPRDRRKSFGVAASAVMVVWVIANLWLPLFATGLPVKGYGVLIAERISAVPQPGVYRNDDELYRRVYYLMHQGEPYYASFRDAWLGFGPKPPLPDTPTGYRLPTFFWIWKLLPPDAFSIVYLYLALCSVGAVAAACVAGQLVGARFAPLAAAALAAFAMGVGITPYLFYVDLPAMCIALVGVALFVRATLKDDSRTLWAAAAVLALAALTREILAYLIVFAALSALLHEPGKRLRSAVPWLAALGVFVLGYAAHVAAVQPYLQRGSGQTSYLNGGLDFVASGIKLFAFAINGYAISLGVLVVLGAVGAYAAHQRTGWPFSAFATASVLLPMLVMLRIGNPAVGDGGHPVNYWGMLTIPLALALWPAWALLLQRRTPEQKPVTKGRRAR
jgi:hypothetical protein